MLPSVIWESLHVQFGGVSRWLWCLEHFLAARCAFSDRNPITLDSSEKKTIQIQLHKSLAHIYFEMPIIWTQDDPLKLRNSSSNIQMQGFTLFSILLFRVETVEFRQRLYLYVFLTTWWQSLKKCSPSQTTNSHYVPFFGVLSDAC